MIGHDVGYGRTRGTGVVGEYSLVFEHRHETVGLRTAALALEIVQRALAGTLDSVEPAVAELRSLAETHDVPPLRQHVLCAITGSVARDETREALARHNIGTVDAEGSGEALVVTVSPMYILQAGLPYSHSDIAVILDTTPTDVPERYQDPERAARLLSVVADAVPRDGIVVCPDNAHYIHDLIRDAGRRVAKFPTTNDPADRAVRAAACVATSINHTIADDARDYARSA
jgi:cyanophycin synthetase